MADDARGASPKRVRTVAALYLRLPVLLFALLYNRDLLPLEAFSFGSRFGEFGSLTSTQKCSPNQNRCEESAETAKRPLCRTPE